MQGASRHTASFATRLFPHRVSRVWTAMRRKREPPIGPGPGCSAASSMWTWRPVRFAAVAPCASLRPSPRSRSSRASCVTSSWPPFHLPSPLPAVAKRYSRLPKPTQREPIGEVRAAAVSFTPSRCEMPFEIDSSTGLPRPATPEIPRNAIIRYAIGYVQTAHYRATPGCGPLWQAAAACWGRRQRRERGVATGGGAGMPQGCYRGLRSFASS
jgi:hypothetical protein